MDGVIGNGNWKQFASKLKGKWGKLTNDDLEKCGEDKQYLFDKLLEHYGLAQDNVTEHLKELGLN